MQVILALYLLMRLTRLKEATMSDKDFGKFTLNQLIAEVERQRIIVNERVGKPEYTMSRLTGESDLFTEYWSFHSATILAGVVSGTMDMMTATHMMWSLNFAIAMVAYNTGYDDAAKNFEVKELKNTLMTGLN